MSISELDKSRNLHNESAHSSPIIQKKSYHVIDMESVENETVTPGSLTITKSKDIVCIDEKENSIEHRTDTNEVVDTDGIKSQASLLSQVPPPGPYFQAQWSAQAQVPQQQGQGWYPSQPQPPQQQGQGWYPSQPQPPPYPQQHHQAGWGQGPAQNAQQFQSYFGSPGQAPPEEYQGSALDYNPQERNSFVAMVLAVTCIMLATTAIFIGTVVLTPNLKRSFRKAGLPLTIPCMIVMVGVNYAFMCSACARKLPCNIFLLVLTTVATSGFAAVFSAHYNTELILQAFLATAIIVALCTVLACTSFDFTSYMLYFAVIALALCVCSTIFYITRAATGKKMTMIHLGILIIGTLLQSVILVAELQMILGGKSIELHEDEWALGAFLLYTSIINLFLKMLAILGIFGGDN